MPNLLDDRDKRTIYRKLKKAEYDNMIDLSVRNGEKVRLLDEGAVVTASGEIDFYIEKGALRRYLDEMPESYEGTINLGHRPFAEFPFILGKWHKSDLELVDIGDGRQALDVKLHLDRNSVFVKELHRADYDVGVSAELYPYGEWKTLETEPGESKEVFCVSDLFITDFAIVGECGNVNSSGIDLKGGAELKLKELFSKEEKVEEAVEEAVEETVEETVEEVTESEEETAEEEAVEEEAVEETEEEEVTLAEILEAVKTLKEENDSMMDKIAKLSEENTKLKTEIKDFTEQFPKLSVKLNPNFGNEEVKEEVIEKSRYAGNDGIGEL